MIKVIDLCKLFVAEDDQKIRIYDYAENSVVFEGYKNDIPQKYIFDIVKTIDNLDGSDTFCININTDE